MKTHYHVSDHVAGTERIERAAANVRLLLAAYVSRIARDVLVEHVKGKPGASVTMESVTVRCCAECTV